MSVPQLPTSFGRQQLTRTVLCAAAAGGCALLLSWWLRRRSPQSRKSSFASCVCNTQIVLDNLTEVVSRLESLLKELDQQRFKSEIDRDKYDFISSILSRVRGAVFDLERYERNDFNAPPTTDEIARSIWNCNDATSPKPGTLSVLSDDSFLSAIDDFGPNIAEGNLSVTIDYENAAFYKAGLDAFERGEVTYRKPRWDVCGCENEADFAAKVWCLRQALCMIFEDRKNRLWLIKVGRASIADILRHFRKDPRDFYVAFDRMVEYLQDPANLGQVETELKMRRVEHLNIWDVLFDFILLDSFDDLRKPPSGTAALVKNSFLSQSMRESTLNNLVWSLIKMKRSRLQDQDGFVSRFYDISQIVSPPLIMGLLGGAGVAFEELCSDFKENIILLIQDLFNMSKMRYNSLEDLADDVHKTLINRLETIQLKLSNELVSL